MNDKKENKTQEKNEEEKEENEQIEERNKKEFNLIYNNHSEIISKIIIEKIISLSVTKINCNEKYKSIGNYCFNYIKSLMKPYLKSLYIPYDIEHLKNKNKIIFFDKKKQNIKNSWIEIPEPKNPIIDRYSNDQIKFISYFPLENNIDEGNSINLSNTFLINENEEKKINTIEKEIKKNLEKKKEKKEKKEKNDKDGKDGPWIDLPSYDLPIDSSIIKNNDNDLEINKLRKEKEEEKIKKIKEKLIEDEEKRRLKLKEINNKNIREFDSKRLTFDSNGNIINLKIRNNIENNLGNEFYWSRLSIKEGKVFRHLFLKQIRKSVSYINRKILDDNIKNDNIKNDNKIEEIDENNNEINDNKNNNKRKSFYSKKTAENILGEDIIRNPDLPNENYFIKLRKQKEKDKNFVTPSGQNFDKIIPEIGVNIISNDKKNKKEGGLNFSKKFKKPSMIEFNKLIIDTQILNSQKFQSVNSFNNLIDKSNLTNDNNLNKNENNYIGYNKQFNSNDNPLIQNAHKIISKNNSKDDSYTNSNLSSSISNSVRNYSYNFNSYKTRLLSNEIQLSENIDNKKLRSIFKDNYNYKSYDFSNITKSIKPTSLFSKREKNYNLNNNEINIDKFNSNIIKNKNWGSENDDLNNNKIEFIKPYKSNHIRELGYRIVNTKLPRDRKFIEKPDPFQIRRANWINLSHDKIKNKKL